MGDLFRQLAEWVKEFWPVRIIDAGNQGVLYRQDGTARCLQPGTHFFIPKLQRIEEFACQYQNVDCGIQNLTTKDGVNVTLSLNVAYSIQELALLHTTYQHFDTTVVNDARGHAAEQVTQSTWEEIIEDTLGFAEELQEALQDDVGEVITVEKVTLDQIVRPIPLSLIQPPAPSMF